jgi:hypothetical protein
MMMICSSCPQFLFLMAKQVNLVALAGLKPPPPPPLEEFVAVIRKISEGGKQEADDPVNGPLFAKKETKRLSGAQGVQRSGILHFLTFVDFCEDNGLKYDSLDEYLRGWARRTIFPVYLFDDEADVESCKQQRATQNFPLKELSADSWRSYVNGMMRAYNATAPKIALAAFVDRQFPLLNEFAAPVLKRERGVRAMEAAQRTTPGILTEEELLSLRTRFDANNVLQMQRWNLLIFGFRTGLRAEVLSRLTTKSLLLSQVDGQKTLSFVVGSMKNMPADMAHDAHLFRQVIVSSPDPSVCAIAAFERQCELLRGTASSASGENDFLFRTVTLFSKDLFRTFFVCLGNRFTLTIACLGNRFTLTVACLGNRFTLTDPCLGNRLLFDDGDMFFLSSVFVLNG